MLIRMTIPCAIACLSLLGLPTLHAQPTVEPVDPAEISQLTETSSQLLQSPQEPETLPEQDLVRSYYSNGQAKIAREVALDEQGNYVNHGDWKMWDERGNLIAIGKFDRGKRAGKWSQWHQKSSSPLFSEPPYDQFQPPFLSQATFVDGKLEGEWTIADRDKRKISTLSFANGLRHGTSTWWHASGQKMQEVDYQAGLAEGASRIWSEAGKLTYLANFQHGRRLVSKIEKYDNGQKKTAGVYLDSQLAADGADDWWNAETAQFSPIGNPIKHGTWTAWHPNGQMKTKGTYEHGAPMGEFNYWHPNGQTQCKGSYVDGKKHGPWKWWHENGQRMTEGEFAEGRAANEWRWWNERGQLTKQQNFSDDPSLYAISPSAEVERTSRDDAVEHRLSDPRPADSLEPEPMTSSSPHTSNPPVSSCPCERNRRRYGGVYNLFHR